ncbi:MAG: response regulator [Pseudomonadota bacterium]
MKKIKVMLVDDEEEFVTTLSERIEMRNFSSSVAFTGAQALQIVDDQIPDVMIVDLKMPGIDGMEVLRRVKKAYPKIQVIILTGHGSENDKKEALSLGAFGYLQKPIQIDELERQIINAHKTGITGRKDT